VEIIIIDFCNSTDLLNQIKSQATKIGLSGTLPLLRLDASGHSDEITTKKTPFKKYIITATAMVIPFLHATKPLLIELIKKDYRQEITIKTKDSTIQIKTYQDINKIIETLKEADKKDTKDKDDNVP
jgi:hypothetical protein